MEAIHGLADKDTMNPKFNTTIIIMSIMKMRSKLCYWFMIGKNWQYLDNTASNHMCEKKKKKKKKKERKKRKKRKV
jgi:hypothetical protein